MPENRYTPYTDMTKREFGALSSSDYPPTYFVPADAPSEPVKPSGYTMSPNGDATNTKYMSLEARYGRTSTIATPQEIEWASHYNPLTNTWDTDDPEIVPEEFKTELADYITSVDEYAGLYADWYCNYEAAKVSQWRLFIADSILAISPEP